MIQRQIAGAQGFVAAAFIMFGVGYEIGAGWGVAAGGAALLLDAMVCYIALGMGWTR